MAEPGDSTARTADFVALAGRLADAAGAAVRPHFRTALTVEDKPDATPVTAIDREAERVMRALIAESHPEHGVIGEEYGAERAEAEYVWVLDPIDGTKRFITGNPVFGTLIALLHRRRPLLGLIDMTVLGERWLGVAGRPSLRIDRDGERRVAVRPCAGLAQATLAATTPEMFTGADKTRFDALRGAARMTLYGGDCLNYGVLAEGFIDLVVEADMGAHDFLPLVPVIEGAGGRITDWRGEPLGLESDGHVVAAGDGRVHGAALALLGAP